MKFKRGLIKNTVLCLFGRGYFLFIVGCGKYMVAYTDFRSKWKSLELSIRYSINEVQSLLKELV